jgi:lysozyme family protein
MMLKSHRLVLVFLFFPFLAQAASFSKYAPKLLRFEGAGYGIHKPVWGDRPFSKQEALEIYRINYWNKYHGNHFKSQALAEVVIDHFINAGHGKDYANVKAFQAILGVEQTGKLTRADIQVANEHPNPEELVNSFVKYRVLYYRSRKLAYKYPGWEKRARSFFISTEETDLKVTDYILPEVLEEQFGHVELLG